MKNYRLLMHMIIVWCCFSFGLVFAQEATQEPKQLSAADIPLPSAMETALIPCGTDTKVPCDMIATSMDDIAGVWKQYLLSDAWSSPNGMAFQQIFADGSYNIADTVEHTAQPYKNFPAGGAGSLHFDDGKLTMEADPNAPAPFNNPAVFQVKVLKYDNQPVSLRFVAISDTNFIRLLDLTQVMMWAGK